MLDASSSLPEGRDGPGRSVASRLASLLLGLAPGGVYLADRVTSTAGELLPHRFTLTSANRKRLSRRSALCCTFPSLAAGRRYRPPSPCGARTFLSTALGRPATAPSTHSIDTQPARSASCPLACGILVIGIVASTGAAIKRPAGVKSRVIRASVCRRSRASRVGRSVWRHAASRRPVSVR